MTAFIIFRLLRQFYLQESTIDYIENKLEIDKKHAKLIAKNPTLEIEKKVLPKPQLKTIVIKVSDDIFVHQLYWTAWQTNGKLQFREDIYCLDADLYSKLRY